MSFETLTFKFPVSAVVEFAPTTTILTVSGLAYQRRVHETISRRTLNHRHQSSSSLNSTIKKPLYKGKLIPVIPRAKPTKSMAMFDKMRALSGVSLLGWFAPFEDEEETEKENQRVAETTSRKRRVSMTYSRPEDGGALSPVVKRRRVNRRASTTRASFGRWCEESEESGKKEEAKKLDVNDFFRTTPGLSWADMVDEEFGDEFDDVGVWGKVDVGEDDEKEKERDEMRRRMREAGEAEERERERESAVEVYDTSFYDFDTTTSSSYLQENAYDPYFHPYNYQVEDPTPLPYPNADYSFTSPQVVVNGVPIPKIVLHEVEVPELDVRRADDAWLVGHEWVVDVVGEEA